MFVNFQPLTYAGRFRRIVMIFGEYRIEVVSDTEFRLDGGAMFGVVPRIVWEKICAPDEFNRIRLQTNCLFIETPTEKILIETGIGEKWTEKQTQNLRHFSVRKVLLKHYLRKPAVSRRIFLSSSTRICISTTAAEIR